MPGNISAHEYPLAKVFDDDFLYKVPNYQRPYAWEWEHARELFEDVRDAARSVRPGVATDDYFLGCIVVVKSNGDPESELVDGQQRLTTLTMLFCALRDAVLCDDTAGAHQVNQWVWQQGNQYQGTENIARLALREQDDPFFRNRVQTIGALSHEAQAPSPKTETQKRILDNATRLFGAVKELDANERNELITYLVNHCFLVVVATSNTSAANRIFGVLNTRGLDLSPTDILKSRIAQSASDEHVRCWEDLENDIGRDEFRSLFTHIYTLKTKTRNRIAIEDAFTRDVLGQGFNGGEFVDGVLIPLADTFEKLVLTGFRGDDKANRYLHSLRLVDNNDWVPPALRFVELHGESPDRLHPFLRDLERLAYWMFMTRVWRDPRVRRYIEVLRALDVGIDILGPDSPLQLQRHEKDSMLCALKGDVNMKWARPVLLRLDGRYHDGVAQYQQNVVTVEHVLPQTPREGSEWMTWFPNGDVRREWTWKLANLVLLSHKKNSKANNREFAHKKHAYFVSGRSVSFELTKRVARESEWTPEVLERRQKDLVGMLAKEWRLED